MSPDEQREEIERLKYEIDILKSKEPQEVPEIEEEEAIDAGPVEVEDPMSGDPRGDLAAKTDALSGELSRLREISELRGEKLDAMQAILRKQGYKL